MAQDPERFIAVVSSDAILGELLAVLLGEAGYPTREYPLQPAAAQALATACPTAVVLEIGVGNAGLEFLDAIRAQPTTQASPVIVLGSTEFIREHAHASGNVYVALPIPFEMEDLVAAVAGALAGSAFETRLQHFPSVSEEALRQAAGVLSREERSIMLAWLLNIRQLPSFQDRTDLSPRAFLDSLPRVLHVLVLILRQSEPPAVLLGDPDFQQRLCEHARTRYRQSVPAAAVVQEYQVLRQVIIARLHLRLTPDMVLAALQDVEELLDHAMRMTVTEYTRLMVTEH
jgi:DNA-binding response OmpR family regulator